MKIEKHISALLYRYQCVTVPGFGAFLTEIQPAQLDAGTHTFYPPKKLISFNANLKNNDGLLASHIALQEKISYEQAVSGIKQEVGNWLALLQVNSVLALKNLGDLACNSEGSIVFSPNTPVNYLTDAFGLSAIVSPVIKREELKVQAEALEEIAPIVFTPERKRNYSYLKYAAVFALLAGAGATGLKIHHDYQVEQQTLLVQQAVQEKVQDRIQQATFFIDNPLPAVKLPVKADNSAFPYHVVAGAYRSEANAEKALKELAEKGFKGRILEKNKYGLYPVLYGSYPDYAQAQKNLALIQKTQNREAWLLIKEL